MNRCRLPILIKLSATALILAILLARVEPSKIIRALTEMDRAFLVAAVLLLIPNLAVQGAKWRYMVRSIKPTVTLREVWSSLLVGFSFGLITPGRVGEVARGLCIRNESRAKIAGLTIIDRVSSLLVTGAACILGFALVYPHVGLALGVIFIGVVASGRLRTRELKEKLNRIASKLPFNIGDKASKLIDSLDCLSGSRVSWVFSWSVLFNGVFLAQFYLLVRSFCPVSWKVLAVMPSIFLAKALLPITLADIGVRESLSVLVFSKVGVAEVYAFNAAFLLFLINVLFPALLGLCFIPSIRLIGRTP